MLIIMTDFTENCGHITLSEPENCVSCCHSKGTILAYLQKYLTCVLPGRRQGLQIEGFGINKRKSISRLGIPK